MRSLVVIPASKGVPMRDPRPAEAASETQEREGVRSRPRASRLVLVLLILVTLPVLLVLGPGPRSDRSSIDRGSEGTAALAGVIRRMGLEGV